MQEPQTLDPNDGHQNLAATTTGSQRSTIDTSRPFRSVKEAVAIFGERFLAGEIYTPKPFTFSNKETPCFSPSPNIDKDPQWNYTSPSPMNSSYSHETTTSLSETVKNLEAELRDTKNELKLLKERESENEVALASLNAQLRKNMSKLAEAEPAGRTMAARRVDDGAMIIREGEKKRDEFLRMENGTNSRNLAQILSIGEEEGLFEGRKKEKKVMKKKPVVPLVGDLFSRKKGTLHNHVYSSSHMQWSV